jgi:hypothetical protein
MKKIAFSLTAAVAVTTGWVLTSYQRDTTRSFAEQFIRAENKAWNTGDLRDLQIVESPDVIYHLPGLFGFGIDRASRAGLEISREFL